MSDEAANALNQRIAARLRALRAQAGLSLEALAQRSGVSRSMLSLIERGETSPTAVLLEKLAAGLGTTLAALFDWPAAKGADASPHSRAADQTEWTDPASGYRRKNLSAPGTDSPIQLVEVWFPPGARVAYETAARTALVYQQLWVMAGAIDVQVGAGRHQLAAGDCLAMALDEPVVFHNPGEVPAHYLVAMATLPSVAGRIKPGTPGTRSKDA